MLFDLNGLTSIKEIVVKLSFDELKAEGGHFEGDFAFSEEDMQVNVTHYSADFFPTDAGLYLDVNFSFTYSAPCARCLERTEEQDQQTSGIQLIRQLPEGMTEEAELSDDDMGVCYVETDEIDLDAIIRQEVDFYLPVRMLCSDNCHGLCPVCGKNLNKGECECKTDADPRWSALDKLKNN